MYVTDSAPESAIAPPNAPKSPVAELALNVELVTVAVPVFARPPHSRMR